MQNISVCNFWCLCQDSVDQSYRKTNPRPNANAGVAWKESGITCQWSEASTLCRWHFHPQICNFSPLKRELCFLDWNCCCYLHMQAKTKTLGVKLRIGSAAVALWRWIFLSWLCWDQLSHPPCSGAASPFLPPAPVFSHSASSQKSSPQSLHALGISQNIELFPPWAAPQPSVFNFCAVPGLLLTQFCFAHLPWTRFQQFPGCKSPRAKLSWLLQKMPRAGAQCVHTKQMDPFQPALMPWLEICWFLQEELSTAPALLPPAQAQQEDGGEEGQKGVFLSSQHSCKIYLLLSAY